MKVSVVIPVFNEQDYIGQCLESLSRQDELPDEIIIIDNNCTDSTVEIAARYDVLIIREPKQGLIAARNRGFDTATGHILARCDGDTRLPPHWISYIKRIFLNRQIEAASGPCYFYDAPCYNYNTTLYELVYFRASKLAVGFNMLLGCNMAIRKSTWEEIRRDLCSEDTKVHEDMDIALHMKRHEHIYYGRTLTAGVSARRMLHNPTSFFIEYPLRWARTLKSHEALSRRWFRATNKDNM